MVLPICVVAVAIILSFFGVFYWPGHGPLLFKTHPWAMWMWILSTTALLVSLACLQVQDPGYVQVKDHMKSAYRTCVLVGPPDSSTIEETAIPVASRSGLFGIESMRAKNWCAFCEMGRPLGHANRPTAHCYTCGRCVLDLDHHCPWTGKCIGKGNMFVFNLFLAFLPLSIGFMVLTAFVEAD